jgi:AAA domain
MQKDHAVHANFLFEGYVPSNQPWIVPKLLRGRSLAMLAAAPNSLKTWSGLDLTRACVTGTNWIGHGPVAQSAVMLVMLDSTVGDCASLFRRLTQDFADQGPKERALLQDLVFRYDVQPGQLNLMKTESRDALIEAASSFKHRTRTWAGGKAPENDPATEGADGLYYVGMPTGETYIDDEGDEVTMYVNKLDDSHLGVQVIIIDSLSKVHSAQESVAEQMGIVTANLRIIAEQTGALVVVLHHERKASADPRSKSTNMDMVRGSTVISASFETIISLEARGDENATHVHYHVTKQRGVKLPDWDAQLVLTGDPDEDNKHALGKWAEYEKALDDYFNDEARQQWDPDGVYEPEFTVESLYPAPWPYARAHFMNVKGADSALAGFLKFVVGAGGTTDLETAAQWVISSQHITGTTDPAEKLKAAKKWVKNRAADGRRDGWLLPSRQDTRGVYEASPRALKFYAPVSDFSDDAVARLNSFAASPAESGNGTDRDDSRTDG